MIKTSTGAILSRMKRPGSLMVCLLLGTFLFAQDRINVSITVIFDGQDAASVKGSDLKAEVKGEPVPIISVSALATEHLQYVLLNDASGRNQWPNGTKQQTDAADQVLKEIVIPTSDVGTLVNFSDQVYIDVQNEHGTQQISAKMERNGRGGTVTYDAVVSAARWLAKQPQLTGYRKVMFLFGDGEDNKSRSSLDDAIVALQESRIPLFVVAPSAVENNKQGDHLRQLTSRSGGRVFFLSKDTKRLDFDSLRRNLSQSFRLEIAVPGSEARRIVPFSLSDVSNPQVHITAPTDIALPTP